MQKGEKGLITAIIAGILLFGMLFAIFWWFNLSRYFVPVPTLTMIEQRGGPYANERLQGYKRDQLINAWGKPASSPNSSTDIWQIDEKISLTVNYNWLEEVVSVGLRADR